MTWLETNDAEGPLGAKGAGAAVVFSSGFGEMGAEGKALETALFEALLRRVKRFELT